MRRRTKPRGARRSGFTLIELLVVITIIGVLAALVTPVVQSSRETANKAKCQNNLRQLGSAAQQYHDAYRSFPPGWLCTSAGFDKNQNPIAGDPNCVSANSPYQQYMWNGLIGLIPNLEQANVYNELNFRLHPYSPDNTTSVRRTLDAFVCPSNPRQSQQTAISIRTELGTIASARFGPSDYRGNMAAGFMLPDPTNGCSSGTTATSLQMNNNAVSVCLVYDNGVSFRNSKINLANIRDGATNTMLFGESLDTLFGLWPYAISSSIRTNIDRTINKPIIVNSVKYYSYWMSRHANLVNFARCDGSVTAVKSQINKSVLNKLMTRSGGEAVSSDEFH